MALNQDTTVGLPYNTGGTLALADPSTVADGVFVIDVGGEKWERVFDGGNSIFRASWLFNTGAPADKSALVAIAVANSAIQTIEIDTNIQIDSAVNFSGKTLSVKSGGLITGTYAISNAVIEGNLTQKILEPTGTLTTSKSATGKWHPGWFGATGDGVTDDYAAVNFTVGVANTNAQKVVELIPGNYLLGTNLSVPSGVTLEFSRNAYFTGSTTTISGSGDFISPMSTVFGTGIAPSGFNYLGEAITPIHFGAIGDNIINDSAAFQRMWDYIATSPSKGINVFIPPKVYYTPDTVFLPKTSINGGTSIRVSGYGATLRTDTNSPIWSRHPTSTAESSTCINSYKAVIEGIRFWGNSTSVAGQTNQIGLDIGSTYTWVIKDCSFYRLYIGITALFWLNGRIIDCFFTQQLYCDIIGRYGDWTGATKSNSSFNANLIEGCRFFSLSGSFTTVYLLAADQTTISKCITEGNNPQYNFYYDYDGSTNVNINTFDNIWIESTGGTYTQNTNFQLRAGGTIILKNIQRIYPNRIFEVQSDSSTGAHIILDGVPYIGNLPSSGLTTFSIGGNDYSGRRYEFKNINDNNGSLLTTGTNWDVGDAPATATYDGTTYNGAGVQYQLRMNSTNQVMRGNSISLLQNNWRTGSLFRGVGIGVDPSSVGTSNLIVSTNIASATTITVPTIFSGLRKNILVFGAEASATQISCAYMASNNGVTQCPIISTVRTNGGITTPTSVAPTTYLRIDRTEAYDGTSLVHSARVVWRADGTIATGIVPTSWEVQVMNTAGTLQTAFKIRASGQIELAVAPTTGTIANSILTLDGIALKQIATTDLIATGAQYQLGYYAAAGNKISPLTAITASRALKSDANGLPVAFDTATEPSLTELSYVKGVTSSIQTQINAKISSASIVSGTYTANGDGILTTFTVTHGYTGTPTNVQVTPAGVDSAIPLFVSNITGTTFDVTFTSAPIVGTNNVTFYWTAK